MDSQTQPFVQDMQGTTEPIDPQQQARLQARELKLKRKQENMSKALEQRETAKKRRVEKAAKHEARVKADREKAEAKRARKEANRLKHAQRVQEMQTERKAKEAIKEAKKEADRLKNEERMAKQNEDDKKSVLLRIDQKELQSMITAHLEKQYGQVVSIQMGGVSMLKIRVECKDENTARRIVASQIQGPVTLHAAPVMVNSRSIHFPTPQWHPHPGGVKEAVTGLLNSLAGSDCVGNVSINPMNISVSFKEDGQREQILQRFQQSPTDFTLLDKPISSIVLGKAPKISRARGANKRAKKLSTENSTQGPSQE